MHSIKKIVPFAIFGFILSLICGFFSNSSFIHILLIAFSWAIGFAVLGFFVLFVFDKFLKTEESIESPQYQHVQSSPGKSSSVGNNVDIVIEDQELERTESSNRYSVGDNRQMLNESDFSSTKPMQSGDFVPIRTFENYQNVSGVESKTPNQIESETGNKIQNFEAANLQTLSNTSKIKSEEKSSDLDILPDLGDFVVENNNENQNDEEQNVNESYESSGSFSDSSFSSKRNEKIDNENMQNTELIAKAISSVLSQET